MVQCGVHALLKVSTGNNNLVAECVIRYSWQCCTLQKKLYNVDFLIRETTTGLATLRTANSITKVYTKRSTMALLRSRLPVNFKML